MRKKTIAFMLAALILVACFIMPSSQSFALYNDTKYDSYKNMNSAGNDGHVRYVVPNLYRQDASYTNVKTFPLVVSDSVEYFPLDIFALYSYLEVVYSKLAYGFYINNTKNNHYVAFDLDTGSTTTHDKQNLDIEAKIFYRTYYVPAKAVCDVLGLKFESYDDEENGIRAARISDSKAKYTLAELVTLYSPVKNENPNENNDNTDTPNPPDITVVPDDGNGGGQTEEPPVQPEDPYLKVAARNIYLTFENCPNENTERILDVLDRYGKKAVFFLDKDKMLEFPDTVRAIILGGHSIGIYFSPQASELGIKSNQDIIDEINEANDVLYLLAKRKTRFIRARYGYSEQLEQNEFADYAKNSGFSLYDWNSDAGDYSGRAQGAYGNLINSIVGGRSYIARTVFVRFGSYNASPQVLELLLEFTDKYTQFKIIETDEYTQPVVFVN